MSGLSVTLERSGEGDDTVILKVAGDLTTANYRDLLQPFESPDNEQVKWWVLDMTDCLFLASAGLSAIVRAMKRAKASGGGLALAVLSPRLRSVLALAGLNAVIPQFDSVGEALDSFKKG